MKIYAWLASWLRGRDAAERTEMVSAAAHLMRDAQRRGFLAMTMMRAGLLWDLIATGLRHDLAQAFRSLVRSPGFTAGISLVLGAGVAATATLFALVDAVVLRPLPYDDPDALVAVWESSSSQDRMREGPSPGNVLDWHARNEAFQALTAWMNTSMTLRGRDGATPVTGVQVTSGFFDVFRQRPLLGRTFAADEYRGAAWTVANRFAGGEPILVLSHGLWRSLGGDETIVGRSIHVEGREWRVLGVMPASFAVPDANVGFWTPWDPGASYRGARFPNGPPRDFRFLRVVGRLKPGMTIEAAAARMEILAARMAAEHPQTNSGWSVRLIPLDDEVIGGSRTELLVVFAAVFCLLLLVCANVAGLALVRSTGRTREIAIRLALGAGRGRIARQLAAESALIALLSAGVAVILTTWWIDAAIAFAPADIPRLHEVGVDRRVVLFAAMLSLAVTALAGILPAAQGSRIGIAHSLKNGAPFSGDSRGRLRRALVVVELAAALMLLVGAGLLARSFVALRQVDPGFDPEHLLVLRITPDVARYRTGALAADYYRRVLDALRTVPSVSAAAAVTVLPMSRVGIDFDRPYWREGARPPGDRAEEADIRMATPGYFSTLRLPLVSGREFTDRDDSAAPRVVIVNEALARKTWPGEDATGRSLILDYQRGPYPYEVVGVVRGARQYGPRSEPNPEIFIPHAQNPYLVMNVVVRTIGDPAAVAEMARARTLGIDPDQPVHSVTTMKELAGQSVAQDRFGMLLLALFAAAGLVVAATGVYALLAYTVAQRQREIAVRMAVGASASRVAQMVIMESLTLAALGGAIGLAGAFASGRLAATLLFGITPQDPITLAATAAILVAVVLVATWLPARRATRVDPVVALK